MSAFNCTDYHFNALANFAKDHRVTYWWEKVNGRKDTTDPQRIAEVLKAENYRSVNCRYRDEYGEAPPIKFQITGAMMLLKPVDILKSCHCLEYQSCETDDWEGTEAKAIITAIEHEAIRSLPGYEAAPWGLMSPPTDTRVFSLSDMAVGRG